MKLRDKILSGYGLALILMISVVIRAVLNLVSLGRASDAILRENYQSISAAENMIEAIERQDSATLLVLLGYLEEGRPQFSGNETQFLYWLGRAKDNITVEGEGNILLAIEAGYSEYVLDFSDLCGLLSDNPGAAGWFYHETVLPGFLEVRNLALQLLQINQDTMFAASARASAVAKTAIWSTIGIAAVGIGLALVFSLLLSRRLARPIGRMMQATEAIAGGRYDVHVPEDGSDELGRLAVGFNGMARSLEDYHRMNVKQILSEKRKSEAVLRSITDGVLLVDAGFRITNINPQAARMLGIDAETSRNRHFLEAVNDERLFALIRRTAETGEPPVLEEGADILLRGEAESVRHYQFSITPVRSRSAGLMGVVLLLRDITRLKELDRMKSDFIMTASHELRTPLQSLGMSIDLLMEEPHGGLSEKQMQLLEAAREELLRMKSLVGDLLDLSRIESGKVRMDLARVSPGMLVEKAISVFAAAAAGKSIRLSADLPEDLPRVNADAGKITWVLTNLIGNALRYARSSIILSARRLGQWVHVSVTDDGEGIPPEYQSRIFDRFVQVDHDTNAGGSGLGLAICREIVRAHNGTIWVDSKPGEGSAFTLTLPVSEGETGVRDVEQQHTDRR
jgi:two-component system, NtrC family, sensor histidine kinase KinB